jgi:hypothetical protein
VSSSFIIIILGLFLLYIHVVWWDRIDERPTLSYLFYNFALRRFGVSMDYVGEFFNYYYHLGLISTLYSCRLVGPNRREVYAKPFILYFTTSL